MIDPLDLTGENNNYTRIELLDKYKSLCNIFDPKQGGNKETYDKIYNAIQILNNK